MFLLSMFKTDGVVKIDPADLGDRKGIVTFDVDNLNTVSLLKIL